MSESPPTSSDPKGPEAEHGTTAPAHEHPPVSVHIPEDPAKVEARRKDLLEHATGTAEKHRKTLKEHVTEAGEMALREAKIAGGLTKIGAQATGWGALLGAGYLIVKPYNWIVNKISSAYEALIDSAEGLVDSIEGVFKGDFSFSLKGGKSGGHGHDSAPKKKEKSSGGGHGGAHPVH